MVAGFLYGKYNEMFMKYFLQKQQKHIDNATTVINFKPVSAYSTQAFNIKSTLVI